MKPVFHDKTFKNKYHRPVYRKESANWFGVYPKPPALAGRGGNTDRNGHYHEIPGDGENVSICADAGEIKIMPPIFTFFVMLAFWVALSGKFDLFHLGMGVFSSGLVAWLSHDLLFEGHTKKLGATLIEIACFLRYLVWLFGQIVLANFHIAGLALSLHPRKNLDPHIIKFRTSLKTDFARFVLANSITLTPGTVTVRIEDDVFYVHAISRRSSADLTGTGPGEMERWVAWVFEGRSR
jgi:multicomponent Na+:H+ antiporter subunit E